MHVLNLIDVKVGSDLALLTVLLYKHEVSPNALQLGWMQKQYLLSMP